MSNEKKQQKIDHQTRVNLAFGISAGEWIVSALVGLGSSLTTAIASVRKNFEDEVAKIPGISTYIDKKTHQEVSGINETYAAKLSQLDQEYITGAKKGEGWAARSKEVAEIKRERLDKKAEFIKDVLKIESRGSAKLFSEKTFKDMTLGTWQRFHHAGPGSDRGRIIFHSIIGFTIGTAATLSFFNSVATRHKIERIDDALQSKEAANNR